MRNIDLGTGRKLGVAEAPFRDARNLYKIMAKELKEVQLNLADEIDANFFKGIACSMLSSDEFENALWECFKRCTYEGEKITEDSFESTEGREDYIEICYLIAKENIHPFTKTLMSKYSGIIEELLQPTSQK